jgi:hypothetical protein
LINLEGELKECPKYQRESLKQGIFDVLISQITLPLQKDDMKRIEAASQGLSTIQEFRPCSMKELKIN